MWKNQAPVIVIGMHRSGTGAFAEALHRLGIEMGRARNIHSESLVFRDLNDWLFESVGGRWDRPVDFRYLVSQDDLLARISDHLSMYLQVRGYWRHLGAGGVWRAWKRDGRARWGWKDPRNTFTLPVWLKVFPEARVIHVLRHGVDVAASVHRREWSRVTSALENYENRRLHYAFRGRHPRLARSMVAMSLDSAIDLWMEYVDEARNNMRESKGRSMEIRYEDYLGNPEGTLEVLGSFCGVDVDEKKVAQELGPTLDKSRAFAYDASNELRSWAANKRDAIEARGYGI